MNLWKLWKWYILAIVTFILLSMLAIEYIDTPLEDVVVNIATELLQTAGIALVVVTVAILAKRMVQRLWAQEKGGEES